MALNDTVPSSATDVFKRNAEDADKLLNSSGAVTNRLGNQLLSWEQISQSHAAWNNRGAWATATAYAVNDVWLDGGAWYVVLSAYTSGATAAADIAGSNVIALQSKTNNEFQGLSDAVAAIAANPSLFPLSSTVFASSYRTPAECTTLGIAYPDGGGAYYVVVASGTGTADGGSFIDAGTKQLKLITTLGHIDVGKYGAGVGLGDDSLSITSAGSTEDYSVIISSGNYELLTNTSPDDNKQLFLVGRPQFSDVSKLTGFGISDLSILNNTYNTESHLAVNEDGVFGRFISVSKQGTPTKNSESDALLCIAETSEDSSAFDADVVGVGARGYIKGTNQNGRAWGLNAFARIASGGDGLIHAIEANVENLGSDNEVPDSEKAKYGVNVTTKAGSNPATAAYKIGTGSSFHYGIWANPACLVSVDSRFIELEGKFAINQGGLVSIGTDVIDGHIHAYKSDGDVKVKLETEASRSPYTTYVRAGIRAWSAGQDGSDGGYKLQTAEGFSSGNTIFTALANGNVALNGASFGGGEGCFSIKEASVIPSSGVSGSGIFYVEGGALKYRGGSGTITTIAPA